MATRTRFVLIWGVCFYGGFMLAMEPNDLRQSFGRAAFAVVMQLVLGTGYGFAVWHFIQWRKKQLLAKLQRDNSDA
jgi:hypothetical protein